MRKNKQKPKQKQKPKKQTNKQKEIKLPETTKFKHHQQWGHIMYIQNSEDCFFIKSGL